MSYSQTNDSMTKTDPLPIVIPTGIVIVNTVFYDQRVFFQVWAEHILSGPIN